MASTTPTKHQAQIPSLGTRFGRDRRSSGVAGPSAVSSCSDNGVIAVRNVVGPGHQTSASCACSGRAWGSTLRSAMGHGSSALWNASRKRQVASGRRERRRRARGQRRSVAATDERAESSGVLGEDRTGTRSDQDADGGAREPRHQGQGDTEEAELVRVARHHLGHPDRGRRCEHRRRDAGDHPGRPQDPRSHVAQQEEPGAEPPHSARDGQRCRP